jgi:hypothetical protein
MDIGWETVVEKVYEMMKEQAEMEKIMLHRYEILIESLQQLESQRLSERPEIQWRIDQERKRVTQFENEMYERLELLQTNQLSRLSTLNIPVRPLVTIPTTTTTTSTNTTFIKSNTETSRQHDTEKINELMWSRWVLAPYIDYVRQNYPGL